MYNYRSRRLKISRNYNEKRKYLKAKPIKKKSRVPLPEPTERINIPKAIREQIWENSCIVVQGYKTLSIVCPICKRESERKHCHLAHKTSLHNGGSNSQNNLFYICSQCNQSMGTMNVDEYKEFYYY
ncbi:HNH endonuclease [Emiliania huxleyi virus 201]|nr:HNH endonuclease [Emiliania huxleyi virus 203]AEP15634.1 HNH endonuclease [Emiliania huxleyi virus 207]AEP16132.1 HNH endonuclease [Emiliania huxleyi virus 208]AET97978.1 HNH endonuclease [Emiliania huxleyi virus 201]